MTDIEPKVVAAAELLDNLAREGKYSWLRTDWRQMINADRLSMASARSCILGQLGGRYDSVIELIDPDRKHRAAFSDFTEDWLKVLKTRPIRRKLYDHGDDKVWEVMSEYDADRTRKYVLRESGWDYIKTQHFVDGLSDHPKPKYEVGDILKNENGDLFLVGHENTAMRLSSSGASNWSRIDYYEGQYTLTKVKSAAPSLKKIGFIK